MTINSLHTKWKPFYILYAHPVNQNVLNVFAQDTIETHTEREKEKEKKGVTSIYLPLISKYQQSKGR